MTTLLQTMRRFLPAGIILLTAVLALLVAALPWDQYGAPLLSFLVFGGAALCFLVLDSSREERPFVLRLFFAALSVHLLAAVVYNAILRGPWLSDALSYDRVGAVLAGFGGQNLPTEQALGPLAWIAGDLFPRFVGFIYSVIGRSPYAIVAMNIALGACSVYLIYRIASIILGPATARWAGWMAVFYSGFWIFSLMMLKDALGAFLLLLFFYYLYRLWNRLLLPAPWWQRFGISFALLALLAGTLLVAGEVREYIKPALLASAASLILVWFARFRVRWQTLGILAIMVVAAILLWPNIADYRLGRVNLEPDSGLGQVVQIPPTDTIGSLAGWALRNPIPFGKYMLLAAGSTAIAPFAWILPVGNPDSPPFTPYTVAAPGMWLWYACIPFCALGIISAWRRSKGEILPLLLLAAGLFLVFSLIIPRESRHRDIILPILLIFSAEGVVYCRNYWMLGLFFWVPLSLFMAWKIQALDIYALAVTAAAAILVGWFFLLRGRGGKIHWRGG